MLSIRLGNHHKDPLWLKEFLHIVKENPGCCDEVWIPSEYGFPPMEKHQKAVESWREAAKLLRAAGIQVSLQISNTVGHGQYMQAKDCTGLVYPGSQVRHMVGADGTKAQLCFCCSDPVFRDYTYRMAAQYASLLPSCVWVDDDLRAEFHDPVSWGCFCPQCMETFNQRWRQHFSRQELVEAVNRGEEVWRKRWTEFVRQRYYDFTYGLTKAILAVSPDSEMAYQYPVVNAYGGRDVNYLFEAMRDAADGRPPKSRPGSGFYGDDDPNGMLPKSLIIRYGNAVTAPFVVDRWPEIENLPYSPLGKTFLGTCTESSLYLAAGCNGLTYAVLMNPMEESGYHAGLLNRFHRCRPYWEALIERNGRTSPSGCHPALSPELHLRPLKKEEPDFSYAQFPWFSVQALEKMGMPLAFEGDCTVKALTQELCDALSNQQLEYLLAQPVITTGQVVNSLAQRGIFCGVAPKPIEEIALIERMTEVEPRYPWCTNNGDGTLFTLEGRIEKPLGQFFSVTTGNALGISGCLLTTPQGGRWAVIGAGLWSGQSMTGAVSQAKCRQILQAADWASGKGFAALPEEVAKTLLLPRVNQQGRTALVSVLNRGIEAREQGLLLRIRRPAGLRLEWWTEEGFHSLLSGQLEEKTGDLLIRTPALPAWRMGSLFLEEEKA